MFYFLKTEVRRIKKEVIRVKELSITETSLQVTGDYPVWGLRSLEGLIGHLY